MTTDRRRFHKQIPSKRCSAKSSRTGEPCRHWSMVGADVCQSHGGRAPQVRRAAEARITLAEALANGSPRRHAWEVLDDALHAADALFRQVLDEIRIDGTTTPAQLEKLRTEIERVHRLARGNLDAGIAERRQRFAESQANQMQQVFMAVLGRLGLTAEQRARVPAAVKAEIGPLLAIEAEVIDDAR